MRGLVERTFMELEKEENIEELRDKGLRVKCGSPSFFGSDCFVWHHMGSTTEMTLYRVAKLVVGAVASSAAAYFGIGMLELSFGYKGELQVLPVGCETNTWTEGVQSDYKCCNVYGQIVRIGCCCCCCCFWADCFGFYFSSSGFGFASFDFCSGYFSGCWGAAGCYYYYYRAD